MAGKTVVKCPGCQSQLGLQMSQQELAGKKIRCPKCERMFSVKLPASKAAATKESKSAKADPAPKTTAAAAKKSPAAKQKAKAAPQASPAKPAAKPKKKAAAVSPKASPTRKKKKKKRPEPEELEEYEDVEFFDDDLSDDGFGGDLYGDDLYGDDYGAGDDFGAADDYGAPSPKRKKKKKSGKSGKSKKKKSEAGESPNHGFLGWLGYGLGAAAVCTLATALIGMTGVWFLVVIMAIVTGSVVGGAVRYAAGYNLGWGPGIVAVVLAFGSILAGRVIVIANDPDSFANRVDRHSPEQIAADIEKYSSEEAMISQIADEIEEDNAWLSENNVTESMLEEHRENFDYDDPFEEHHLPAVWAEATNRWQAKPDNERQQLMEQARSDMRSEYGIMTPEEVDALIAEQTTDESMIANIAQVEVEYDDDWLQQAGVTENAIESHWDSIPDDSTPKDRYLPAVWEEATVRWNALDDAGKAEKKQEVASELRAENGVDDEANAETEQAIGTIKIFLLFGSALVSMIFGLGTLFCTGSGLTAAFKIGSGMAQ